MASEPPAPALQALQPLRSRLRGHLQALEQGLLERDTATRLLLLAALAGEHVLLIGPPGTAKSELARRLHRAFDGARYFERLLTRFSTPEELFGPLSLKALEDDRYERLIDGYLPTAGIAFLDEVFKANSAILNALLTLLNEREFDNGAGRLATPLISVIGASNEPPADESLLAFHDRFLLRVPVAPVGDAAFAALLQLDEQPVPAPPAPISAAERDAVRAAAATVRLGDEALAALTALRGEVARQGQSVSDRRWRQLVALLRVAAATEGRGELDAIDLWLAPCVVCADLTALPRLAAWVTEQLVQAVPQPLTWLDHAVTAFEKQLEIEQRAPAEDDGSADGAGKIALARSLGGAEAEDGSANGMLRFVASTLEDKQRRRYSPVHVAARLAQVDAVARRAEAARTEVQAALDTLAARLAPRLWLPPTLAEGWLGAHRQTLATLSTLLARLAATRQGFAAQPVDDQLAAQVPPPVLLDAA
jgi:MoxR-like ATPase